MDFWTDLGRLAESVVIRYVTLNSVDRDATTFWTEADETMAFGNGDLILIEDAAITSPVIMEIVCNRTGEHSRRWLRPSRQFQRHFSHSDFRLVELTLE